jgi:hypothetical protein
MKLKLMSFLFFAVGFANAQLPVRSFVFESITAIVVTDPQNDFLSIDGVVWGVVGENVRV